MKNIVTIDHYKSDDHLVVFINGHALGHASCTTSIAYSIAKEIGQEFIPITTYNNDGPPSITTLKVIEDEPMKTKADFFVSDYGCGVGSNLFV